MSLRRLGAIVAVTGLAAGRWLWWGIRESPGPGSPTVSVASSLDCPPSVSLGRLNPGDSATVALRVFNPTSTPRTIERVETSCECVQVASLPVRVGPRAAETSTVSYVPKPGDRFRGSLGVDLVGRDGADRALFKSRVALDIAGPERDPARDKAS